MRNLSIFSVTLSFLFFALVALPFAVIAQEASPSPSPTSSPVASATPSPSSSPSPTSAGSSTASSSPQATASAERGKVLGAATSLGDTGVRDMVKILLGTGVLIAAFAIGIKIARSNHVEE